ncbi:hypothetical protein [Vannielia litorea]|uniref:hypothetical protein n=1 Tax=Vannielia litorea TaxID=1217970 RepID=UPI001BCB2A35|nr:hypothetical protein [Vannielia litorea]
MAKVKLTELPIHVYTCMTDPQRPPVAMIGNLHFVFRGETPMKARKAADDWRKVEAAKLAGKRSRIVADALEAEGVEA